MKHIIPGTPMSLRRVLSVSRQLQIQQLAREAGREVFLADDPGEALHIIETVNPDLVILDHSFGPGRVREFRDMSDKNLSDVAIVVVGTGQADSDRPDAFIEMGAVDYLHGEQDYGRLKEIVSRLKDREKQGVGPAAAKVNYFAEDFAASVSLVGTSKATLRTLEMIKLVAQSRCNPVLVVGETGTGKEIAAKAVHSLRHPGAEFIAVNCAALTANLLESELFGHAKGSFTGADKEKTGLLELAGSGTLFLDEISEMPTGLQAKLLRVLQEKTFRKVGGIKSIVCKATIIASSNRDLGKEVQANRFRRDLYYRLNICPVVIPPLRAPERRRDIGLLAGYFLETSKICPEKSGKIKSLTRLGVEALEKHDWPGNVRELRNVIERAILLETTDKVGLSSIRIDSAKSDALTGGLEAGHVREFSLAKAERELIAKALQETGWQKTRAAALLGITRATLYAKVKQYNIEKGSYVVKQTQHVGATPPLSKPAIAAR